jgi:hypothetical protein
LQIDVRSISPDKLKAFQPSDTFCRCRRRELNSPTKLCYRKTRIAAEFLQDSSVNQVGSMVLKHWLTVSKFEIKVQTTAITVRSSIIVE